MKLDLRMRKLLLFFISVFIMSITSFGQIHVRILEVMDTATMEGQLEYVREKTNIYNGYRAVHEEIFRKLSKNALDTINLNKKKIEGLTEELRDRSAKIDSFNLALNNTKSELTTAAENRDKLSFLGIQMDKALYYSIVYTIIVALIVLLVLGYLVFKKNRANTRNTRKDLDQLKDEFEEYRKNARERHEALVLSHFNEIKKLKEGGRG